MSKWLDGVKLLSKDYKPRNLVNCDETGLLLEHFLLKHYSNFENWRVYWEKQERDLLVCGFVDKNTRETFGNREITKSTMFQKH